jgi:hypothetical protein
VPASWRRHSYSASAAYQTAAQAGGDSGNQANRHLECLWFSPHCLNPQPGLFSLDELEAVDRSVNAWDARP